jgi:superoxide reductase
MADSAGTPPPAGLRPAPLKELTGGCALVRFERAGIESERGTPRSRRTLQEVVIMLRASRFIAVVLMVAVAVSVSPIGAREANAGVGALYKTDDWKGEKHVPVIECPTEFTAGEPTTITVSVGKEIAHPNTTGHHIRWIRLYFMPSDSSIPYEIANFDFAAHGESILGADSSTLYADPKVTVDFRTGVAGALYAAAYCNIHGLWESMKPITVAKPEADE